MTKIKDILSEGGTMVPFDVGASPLARVDSATLAPIINKVATMCPHIKNKGNLTTIAFEAHTFRIVPGRDIHYWENSWDGALQRTFDYKFLKNFANWREKLETNDQSALVEDHYDVLSEVDKSREGIADHCIAAACTITSKRERVGFADTVKEWLSMGFDHDTALAVAKDLHGGIIGTRAVGVVDPTETDKKGKPITPPTGWSFLQWARKLAFKNAVMLRFGIPTADQLMAMTAQLAKFAQKEDWDKVLEIDLPAETQARLADMYAKERETKEKVLAETPDERREGLKNHVELMRGTSGIDEDPTELAPEQEEWETFVEKIILNNPFFEDSTHIRHAMIKLDLSTNDHSYSDINQALVEYAHRQADLAADEPRPEQQPLIIDQGEV